MGFLSDVFDPGRGDRDRAAGLADEGIIRGGNFSGPGGIGGSFDFSGGKGTSSSSLGSFQSSLEGFQSLTASGINQAQGGLPPELSELAGNTIGELGEFDISQLTNEQDFAGLGSIFQNSVGVANSDPFALGSEVSAKLRALSERRNQRSVNKFFDRLKSTGNLTSSAGVQRAGDLERNLMEQGLQFDLAGLNAGQSLQQQAFQRAMGASQGREQIGARNFGESLGINQFADNAALQQFGVGSNLFSQFLQNQSQGANIALQGNQAAMNTAQLPLAFQQALLASQGQASNSLFGAAGVNQNNASMAQSPFLNALTTAGSFAGAIAPGGFLGNPVGGGT